MFKGKDIEELVKLFNQRGVVLYHACQLADLKSYLYLGGIPSRALLEGSGCNFTKFASDEVDKRNGVWDKVFLNLSDFGANFASPKNSNTSIPKCFPNPYGPILLVIKPEALLEASDVAICLRSAWSRGFSREKESLSNIRDVNRIFVYPLEGISQKKSEVKYRVPLKTEFAQDFEAGYRFADPEMSCSVVNGRISTKHITSILVDHYVLQNESSYDFAQLNIPLVDRVRDEVSSYIPWIKVSERLYTQTIRKELLKNLICVLSDISGNDIADLFTSSKINRYPLLNDWIVALRGKNLEKQFHYFADYFFKGTFNHIHAQCSFEEAYEYYCMYCTGEYGSGLADLERAGRYLEFADSLKDVDVCQYSGMIRLKLNDYVKALKNFETCSTLLKDSEYTFVLKEIQQLLKPIVDRELEKTNKSINNNLPDIEPWIEYADNWYEDEDDLYDQHPDVFGGLNPYDMQNMARQAEHEEFIDKLEDLEGKLLERVNLIYRPYTIQNIFNEMKRIGWDIEQGKEYLKNNFNKVSRYQLDKEELIQFLLYLKSQESKVIFQDTDNDDIPF
jgi:hypothetical protein